MRIITAPEEPYFADKSINVFLAGGITNCREWQKEVLADKNIQDLDDSVFFYNPRRKNFPIEDPNASLEQIKWEFNAISHCDIFSMFFDIKGFGRFHPLGWNSKKPKVFNFQATN